MPARFHGLSLRMLRLANHDFCPWANRWVLWIRHPVALLAFAAIAATINGIFVNPQTLMLAASLAALLVLGLAWPQISLWGLQASLEFEQTRGREGEPAWIRLKIRNRAPWPVWGVTLDRGFRRFGSETGAWTLARIAGWSTADFRLAFVPPSRGEYPCEPVRLSTAFPLGLWRAERGVPVTSRLLVWPRIIPLRSIPDAPDLRLSDDVLSSRRTGDSGDLLGTRQFRRGDSLRQVHWVQTARLGRLIVSERQSATRTAAQVEFDLDPTVHSGSGPDGTLEWTIRLGASICHVLREHHAAVECVLGSERVTCGDSLCAYHRFLDRLSRLPFEGVPRVASRGSRSNSPLRIICTTPQGLAGQEVEPRGFRGRFVITEPGEVSTDTECPHCRTVRFQTAAASVSMGDCAEVFRRHWERSCHAFAS